MTEKTYYVTVGGTHMRGWSVFFRVVSRTYKALRAARAAEGCIHADIFRDGRRYFNLSVWTDTASMKKFASTGVHGVLMQSIGTDIVDFKSISFPSAEIPDRATAKAIWRDQTGKT